MYMLKIICVNLENTVDVVTYLQIYVIMLVTVLGTFPF